MKLSIRTWITFFLLAIILGLNNVYSSLLTGWGDGGSIIAVVLCLLFLTSKERNIINYNLGQTMASAGGSVGFTVAIVSAIYYTYSEQGVIWEPSLFNLSLFVMSLAIMGVALAAPLRRFVVHWFFPSGVACATILKAVTSDDHNERLRACRIMGVSGALSALITLPAKVASSPGGKAIFNKISLGGNLHLSIDPLLYGIGLVIGPRIGFSMLLSGLIHTFWLVPQLTRNGAEVEEYTRWIAVGLMTLPAFSSMIFALVFKTSRSLPPGFEPKQASESDRLSTMEWLGISALFLLALAVATVQVNLLFKLEWYYMIIAACISVPMCFALGKVASETDINPIRLIAIAFLFIFSLFGQHSPVSLLAIGISGAAFAAIAVDLFYDLRTGYLIGANPKQQIVMQFLGVIPVAFVTVYFLDMLAVNFGFGEGKYFPAPGSIVWATMAEAFSEGASAVPSEVWIATGVASGIGIVFTLFENWKPTKAVTPSAFALGIGLLLPFDMCAAIFVGSLIRFLVHVLSGRYGNHSQKRMEEAAFKSGSAIIAAASIAGIISVFLITLGIFYIPNGVAE